MSMHSTSLEMNQITRWIFFVILIKHSSCTCPSNYDLLEGRCFRFVSEAKTFSEALAFCKEASSGSNLFAPTNQGAFDTINNQAKIQFATQPYWIGIADYDDEGRFIFVDGEFQNKEIKFFKASKPLYFPIPMQARQEHHLLYYYYTKKGGKGENTFSGNNFHSLF